MKKSGFTGALARRAALHPWWTITAWIVTLVVAFLAAGSLGDVLVDGGELSVETESETAGEIWAEHFESTGSPQEYVLVEGDGLTTDDPGFAAKVTGLVSALRQVETVDGTVSYLDGAPGMTSADGSVALAPLGSLDSPILLAGTALAFLHLLNSDGLPSLPDGSQLLETGGYKGLTIELDKTAFYEKLSRAIESFEYSTLRLSTFIDSMENLPVVVDTLAHYIGNGQGTLGRMLKSDEFYEELRKTNADIDSFVVDFKRDPDKYTKKMNFKIRLF